MMRIPQWLKIQRAGLFLFLAFGVLLLIYALGFISDVYIFYAYGNKSLADFYREMQGINTGLLWKAILVIIFAIVLFFLELGRHPAGLITLIIATLIGAVSLFICADSLVLLAAVRQKYTGLDLSSLNLYIERGAIQYRYSTLTYDLGLGGYVLFLFSSLFMAATVMRNACTVRQRTANEK